MAAYARAASVPSSVPTAAVRSNVEEYALTAPAGARIAPGALDGPLGDQAQRVAAR